jgi:hypothetical protein
VVLTTQHRPAVTEQPGEREQADGECDPGPHLAEASSSQAPAANQT